MNTKTISVFTSTSVILFRDGKFGRMSNILLSRAAVLLAMIFTCIGTSVSQQTAQLTRIPQFENDDVNVWKTTVPPNAPLVMHTHEHPRVIVALSGGTMKTVYENGPTGSAPVGNRQSLLGLARRR